MQTFVVTLHVIAAVFIVGPLAVIPHAGLRGIRLRDPGTVQGAARQTTVFGVLSLVAAALGVAAVPLEDDRYDFGSAWVTISMTLYLIAVLLALLVVAPSLNRAAKLLATDPAPAAAVPAADEPVEGPAAVPAAEVTRRLDSARGRVAATGGITSLLLLVVVILMVVKPFG